jgi:mRNA interferase YafQ
LNVFYTTQFKKDYKRVRKQGKDLSVLEKVIRTLCRGEKPAPRHKDHRLSGCWNRHRKCHIRSDWLLIYRLEEGALYFERTGSHSELFE